MHAWGPHLVQQVPALDELLDDEQRSRVLFVVVNIRADAIARYEVPAAFTACMQVHGMRRMHACMHACMGALYGRGRRRMAPRA